MQLGLTLIAAFGLLAAAAPAAEKRDETGVKDDVVVVMCQNEKWKEPCQPQAIPIGECTKFSNDYAGKIKAIQNVSSVKCTWYLTDDCTGKTYDNQNDQKLTDGNGQFANMRSAKCQ